MSDVCRWRCDTSPDTRAMTRAASASRLSTGSQAIRLVTGHVLFETYKPADDRRCTGLGRRIDVEDDLLVSETRQVASTWGQRQKSADEIVEPSPQERIFPDHHFVPFALLIETFDHQPTRTLNFQDLRQPVIVTCGRIASTNSIGRESPCRRLARLRSAAAYGSPRRSRP